MEDKKSNILPEDCISHILSFTSPRAVSISSLVSSIYQSASESDVIWEKFLPSDYQEILSRSVSPVPFSSKKELYFRLCDSILMDAGLKTFSLEKSTSKKCYILSARELSITWGNFPLYWTWKSLPQSRFAEVAELRTICWLEIHGKMNTRMLSPNTTYAAYLIVKFADRAYGLDSLPADISVEVRNYHSRGIAYLRRHNNQKILLEHHCFSNHSNVLNSRGIQGDGRVPSYRNDGWMEIELGEFFNYGGDDGDVKMSLREVKGSHLKGGLIIEGIEVRPKE